MVNSHSVPGDKSRGAECQTPAQTPSLGTHTYLNLLCDTLLDRPFWRGFISTFLSPMLRGIV